MTEKLPPDLLLDEAPPFTDDELAMFFAWADSGDWPGEEMPDADELPPGAGPAPRWPGPRSDAEAAWAMSKFREKAERAAALRQLAADRIARIGAWLDEALKAEGDLDRSAAFFADHLERYAIARRISSGDKIKSLPLPDGKVATRASSAKAVVVDEEAALAWAEKEAPDAIARRLLLTPLRASLELIEVPTRIVCSPCAEVVSLGLDGIDHPGAFAKAHQVGTAIECPSCGAEALVGQWLESELVAADADGAAAPGLGVEPARLSATVTLADQREGGRA